MKNYSKIRNTFVVFFLFIITFSLRLYGLNWDQNQHLHPDERFLTMVTSDISLPSSISEYFNSSKSPLNPYNYSQYQFFVYGTFPLFLTKIVAHLFNQDNYEFVFLWGRGLSALFDSLNIIFLYFLAKKLFTKKTKCVFLPSLLYTFCVIPLQLSHFYAVDTFLNTLLLATFTALSYELFPLAAITFGLALASKISAVYFVPIIFLFLIRKKKFHYFFVSGSWFLISILTFRIFQPYVFTGFFKINPLFISNLQDLQEMAAPTAWYPPSVQWLSKIPLLDSLRNLIFWGLGLPLSFLFLFSLFKINIKKIPPLVSLSLIWIIGVYFYQGSQFAHTMRYFIPVYPFVCLVAGFFSEKLNSKVVWLFIICHVSLGLIFLNIYSRPHSRIQASRWIYQNIAAGSTLTTEYWDDALPLSLNPPQFAQNYSLETLYPYDEDSPEKMTKLTNSLSRADYLVMSSNRLWASIPQVPSLYPFTTKYYQDLFSEKLGFTKTVEINSYPGLSVPFLKKCFYFGPTNFPGVKNKWFSVDNQCFYPGFYLRDDTAEEAFTVYDHPKVLIFSRRNN